MLVLAVHQVNIVKQNSIIMKSQIYTGAIQHTTIIWLSLEWQTHFPLPVHGARDKVKKTKQIYYQSSQKKRI